MEGNKYLEPGFDPTTLKIAHLRNVLLKHDIDYPSTAKKAELVVIFKAKLSPKAPSLLSQQKTVVGSSKGIVSVPGKTRKLARTSVTPSPEEATKAAAATTTLSKETTPAVQPKKLIPLRKLFNVNDPPLVVVEATEAPPLTKVTASPVASRPSSKKTKGENSERTKLQKELAAKDSSSKVEKPTLKRSAEKKKKVLKEKAERLVGLPGKHVDNPFSTANIFQASARSTIEPPSAETSFDAAIRKAVSPKKLPVVSPTRDTKAKKTLVATDAKIKKVSATSTRKHTKAVEKSIIEAGILSGTVEGSSSKSTPPKSSQRESTPLKTSEENTSLVQSSATPLRRGLQTPVRLPLNQRQLSQPETPSAPRDDPWLQDEGVRATEVGVTIRGTPPRPASSRKATRRNQGLIAPTAVSESAVKLPATSVVVDEEVSDDEEEPVSAPVVKGSVFWHGVKRLFVTSIVLLGLLFGVWYRDQRILVGYCGSELSKATFTHPAMEPLESFMERHRPVCHPCPANGRCDEFLELRCYDDYVETYPWYSFNGLLPVPGWCVPDTRRAERINRIIDYTLELLRERNAEVACGESADDLVAGLSARELRDMVFQLKADYISPEEFDDIWNRALVELEKESEIKVLRAPGEAPQGQGEAPLDNEPSSQEAQDKVLRSTSLANVSFRCRFKRKVLVALGHLQLPVGVMVALMVAVKLVQRVGTAKRARKARLNHLYSLILKKLQTQQRLAAKDPKIQPYVGAIHLRDLLLADTPAADKTRLWLKVAKKVEYNTCVRAHMMEVHGEIMKVWEWVANIDA